MANDKKQGLRKRGSKWYVRVQIDGRRVEIPAGTDYNQAKAYRKEILEQKTLPCSLTALESNNPEEILKTSESTSENHELHKTITYSEAVKEHYDNHLQFKTAAVGMRCNLNASLAAFGERTIDSITWQEVEKFKNSRLKILKPSTVKRELTMMGAVLKRQIKADRLRKNPLVKIDMPKVKDTRERVLTDEEFKKLLTMRWEVNNNGGEYEKGVEPYTRLALIIADYTAMRIGEVLNLKVSDVDFQSGIIFVRRSKNGEKREVPIHDELRKILEDKINPNSEYVINNKGKRVDSIRKGFIIARKKAGLNDFRIHDLRHRAITRWVQMGFPANVIMKASGHKTYSAFNRYANLKSGDIMMLVGKKRKVLPHITKEDLQDIAA